MRKRNLDNRGSALVVVLAVLSLLALLGATGLSTAVVNVQMRGMNRLSDQNFYHLEAAWDEIYEKLGYQISEMLKNDYADVLANLYKNYETNAQANAALRRSFKEQLGTMLGTTGEDVAQLLDSYYDNPDTNQLEITVGALDNTLVNGYRLDDLSLTYVDPQTGTTASITMDLEISVPDIQFINDADVFSDYVLISNGGIHIKKPKNGGEGNLTPEIQGSVRADRIEIGEADVTMSGSKLIAANEIHIGADNTQSSLSVGADSAVWANDIILSGIGSKLYTNGTDLNIKDDLTIRHDNCEVKLNGGNYYGYGNEGSPVYGADHTASSAIIIKGKNNRLDIRTDSLTLAGHSYLKFEQNAKNGTGETASTGKTYPMAESVALKSTQTIYLIPEDQLKLVIGETKQTTGNPVLLPSEDWKIAITSEGTETLYDIRSELAADAENDPKVLRKENVIFVKQGQKLYVFYNFDNDSTGGERKEYFEEFLKNSENVSAFNSLLQKAGWGTGTTAGIRIADDTNIVSAGSIYRKVDAAGDEDPMYEVISGTGTTSTMKTIQKISRLSETFQNLSRYLTETAPRTAKNDAQLPVGQYIDKNALETVNVGNLIVTPVSCQLDVNDEMEGLVISGGKVTVTGSGTFRGLIISFGSVNGADGSKDGIDICGNVNLIADASVVQECIKNGGGNYLYDYSETADTVLSDYSWFLKESNWMRGKKATDGGTS